MHFGIKTETSCILAKWSRMMNLKVCESDGGKVYECCLGIDKVEYKQCGWDLCRLSCLYKFIVKMIYDITRHSGA